MSGKSRFSDEEISMVRVNSESELLEIKSMTWSYKTRLARKVRWNLENGPVRANFAKGKNLFLTLTYAEKFYNREKMSPGEQFRVFMNRLKSYEHKDENKRYDYSKMSYFACVEEGSVNNRIHIHACLSVSKIPMRLLYKCWSPDAHRKNPYGYIKVGVISDKPIRRKDGTVVNKGAGLVRVARYISKYITKDFSGKKEPMGVPENLLDESPNVNNYKVESVVGRLAFYSRDFVNPPKNPDSFPILFLGPELFKKYGIDPVYKWIPTGDSERKVLDIDAMAQNLIISRNTYQVSDVPFDGLVYGPVKNFIILCKLMFSRAQSERFENARDVVKGESSLYSGLTQLLDSGMSPNEAIEELYRVFNPRGVVKLVFRKVLREYLMEVKKYVGVRSGNNSLDYYSSKA